MQALKVLRHPAGRTVAVRETNWRQRQISEPLDLAQTLIEAVRTHSRDEGNIGGVSSLTPQLLPFQDVKSDPAGGPVCHTQTPGQLPVWHKPGSTPLCCRAP